jgi:hypothetical protein
MATLTKTLITKRDRALENVEWAIQGYNEVLSEIADDLSSMADDIRKQWDAAYSAAIKAQSVLDEVRDYAQEKQAVAEAKDDDDEAEAWAEIAESHNTDCEIFPEEPAEPSETMDDGDVSCSITDFIDEA